MKYTLQQLFEVIDEKKEKEEFYYNLSNGGWGADYYLDRITRFAPNDKIIISSERNKRRFEDKNIAFQQVKVDGLLLFEYTSHTEEYTISRLDSFDEATAAICGENGVLNMFSGDIIVIEDGRRKRFYVKDASGALLKWNDIESVHRRGEKIFVEWH